MKRKHYPIILILIACAWVASVAGANSLDVNASAAMGPGSSVFGLDVILLDPGSVAFNPAWVLADESKGFNAETTLKGSFFLGPENVTMSQSLTFNHFQTLAFLSAFGPEPFKVPLIFFLHRDNSSGNWFLTAWHFNENAVSWVFSGTGFLALYNNAFFAQNLVEFEWTAGDPGTLQVWRTVWTGGAPDPSGRIQLMNVSLAGMQTAVINKVIAGIFAGHKVGTFGSLYLDEFVFTR